MSVTLRGLMLVVAALLCLASSGADKSRRDQGPEGGWWCHNERSGERMASQCRPDAGACESERQSAQAGGLEISECAQVPRVSCFQIGGDPEPAAAWCAATAEDCEFWRRLDEGKNGSAGQRCEWR